MVADTKPSPYWKEKGIPITGLSDSANGPVCGDCARVLLTKQWPVDGYQCPICRRIWMHHVASRALARHLAYKVKCVLCNEHWLEGEGHICPTLPTPRRREAIYATKRKNGY
jgi:hypothetical protein